MRIRETAAVAFALIAVISLVSPAFAATGYGSGTIGDTNSAYKPPGSSSGSSSSSSSSTGSSSSPPSSTAAPTAAQIASMAASAIQKAVSAGGNRATVSLVNVAEIHVSTIRDIFVRAAKVGVNDTLIKMDTREGGVVLCRIYVDAETAAGLSGVVNFSAAVKGSEVNAAVNTFEKFFDNKVAAVSLGQKGAFGADIKMAVKADLSGLDTSSLVFYAYDRASGRYATLAAKYNIDSKGYLHFITPVGGCVIIADKPLVRR